jgi:DNA-binding SARP family transcriptional activator
MIAITTLVTALPFTLRYYAKVLYQADLAGEDLLARMIDSLLDVDAIQSALRRFAEMSQQMSQIGM